MKKLHITLCLFVAVFYHSFAQINVHIDKEEEGTFTYAISDIDSIYIDLNTLEKIIVFKDATVESHLLSEVNEATFSQPSFHSNSSFCDGVPTAVVDVLNPVTGKIWMDRNLGASRAATSATDTEAYGDLYQWGRRADGHQCRNSVITASTSSTNTPNHGDFIIANNVPFDWRAPQNNNLWQGVNGVNNPCPEGYRPPTRPELLEERASWENTNTNGAYNSPLKFTRAGGRDRINGPLIDVGSRGYYWTSTTADEFTSAQSTHRLRIDGGGSFFSTLGRANGYSIRCIKD